MRVVGRAGSCRALWAFGFYSRYNGSDRKQVTGNVVFGIEKDQSGCPVERRLVQPRMKRRTKEEVF